MFNISNHGGGCCGISHISDFPTGSPEKMETYRKRLNQIIAEELEEVRTFIEEEFDSDEFSGDIHRLFEVVLDHQQTTCWHDILLKRGFTVAAQWMNSKTDNNLTMYTLAT